MDLVDDILVVSCLHAEPREQALVAGPVNPPRGRILPHPHDAVARPDGDAARTIWSSGKAGKTCSRSTVENTFDRVL